jgi:hypothetical protein
MSSSILSSEK